MNRVPLLALSAVLSLGVLVACTGTSAPGAQAPQSATKTAETTSATPTGPPPTPEPSADGECPYLPSTDVAQANGQLVRKVRLSEGAPTPACFFYADATDVQLSVWVFQGEPTTAKAVVDRAAPIASSNPASSPEGWNGGSVSNDQGAVYAVAKGGAAVVVSSNQQQTIKAKRIAETVVANLGL